MKGMPVMGTVEGEVWFGFLVEQGGPGDFEDLQKASVLHNLDHRVFYCQVNRIDHRHRI